MSLLASAPALPAILSPSHRPAPGSPLCSGSPYTHGALAEALLLQKSLGDHPEVSGGGLTQAFCQPSSIRSLLFSALSQGPICMDLSVTHLSPNTPGFG